MKHIGKAGIVFCILMLALASTVYAQDAISPGDVVEDSLDNNTAEYTFTGKAGELLVIELKSDDFDTLLTLTDSDNQEVGRDDDGGDEGTNSRLAFNVPAAGEYTITVGGFGGDATGSYTLTLEGTKPTAIAYGSTVDGTGDGPIYYSFEGATGDTLNIFASSGDDDDLRLDLTGPSGETVASDDDGGADFNPYMRRVILPDDGVYLLVVSAPYEDEFTSDFSLTIEQTEALFLDATPQTLTLGDEFDQEVFRFEAADDTTYRLVIQSTSGESDLSLSVDMVQGENFFYQNVSFSSVARIAVDFAPEEGGITEVKIRFYSFGDTSEFEISIAPAE